jgi:hypothetical protein
VNQNWKKRARTAGFDPKNTADASPSGGKIRAIIAITDMKHAVIGDGENCSGARCMKRVLDAAWVYIGAYSAFIVHKGSKRITRYLVNGIANRQDRTMSVVGEEVILRPPPKTQTLASKKADSAKRKQVSFEARVNPDKGKTKHDRLPSMAAVLRGSD